MTSNQKKWATSAAAVAVWLAGISAAVVIAFAIQSPLMRPLTAASLADPRSGAAASPAGAVLEAPTLVELDPVWIFGRRFQKEEPTLGVAPVPNVARDISEMHCTGWRELEAGSGHVQLCD